MSNPVITLKSLPVSVAVGTPVAVHYSIPKSRPGNPIWVVSSLTARGAKSTVLGYVNGNDGVTLTDARPVEASTRQAAIQAGANREVCGWIVGVLADSDAAVGNTFNAVRYAPKSRAGFFYADGSGDYTGSAVAVFTSHMFVSE